MFVVLIVIFILVLVFVVRNNTPSAIGKYGESKVSLTLNHLDKQDYKIVNNVLLKSINGNTFQIDHVVVSVYGIYVVETKNYSGWIFGKEKSEYWTQVVFQQKHQFLNPIKQNSTHLFILKEVLKRFEYVNYYSIIVFTGSGEFKDLETTTPVIYRNQLLGTIKNLKHTNCLSHEEINEIVNILNIRNIESKENDKTHVENIHSKVMEKQLKKENLICPNCDKPLVLRNGKYGKFYGCPNYPLCRFTMKY